MKFNKKGDVGVQFNWMYVLLAGGIILLFFGSLVLRQKASADTSIAVDTLSHIDSILTGAKVTKDTVNEVQFGKNTMELDCNSYSIGNVKKNLLQNVVFGPSSVKGQNMLTWSVGWYVPYRLMNFLIVTSAEIRYVFVYNDAGDSLMNAVDALIPEKLPREKVKLSEINSLINKNNYKVRFVLFGVNNFENPPAFANADVSAVSISPSLPPKIDVGNLIFFTKEGNGFSTANTSYVSAGALLAGIFSEDIADYACSMGKALKHASFIHGINKERLEVIKADNPQLPQTCKDIIDNSTVQLGILSTSMNNIQLYGASLALEQKNKEAIRASCPIIY